MKLYSDIRRKETLNKKIYVKDKEKIMCRQHEMGLERSEKKDMKDPVG